MQGSLDLKNQMAGVVFFNSSTCLLFSGHLHLLACKYLPLNIPEIGCQCIDLYQQQTVNGDFLFGQTSLPDGLIFALNKLWKYAPWH
jgi:hypothetical protein